MPSDHKTRGNASDNTSDAAERLLWAFLAAEEEAEKEKAEQERKEKEKKEKEKAKKSK